MTQNEMTNRQSVIDGSAVADQGFLLKEIAVAVLEVAKQLSRILDDLPKAGKGY